jgi:hypothetical protein
MRPNEPPNILWLIGENLGPDLGCYGTKQSPIGSVMPGTSRPTCVA